MLEGWLQNLKIQQDFGKRMCHWGSVDLGEKGSVTNQAWPFPEECVLDITFSVFGTIDTIVQQHPFIGGAAPQLRGCARTEWPHRAGSCTFTVFYFLFSSRSPAPLLNFCGGQRRRLLRSASTCSCRKCSREQKAEPEDTASVGTSLQSQPAAGIYLAISFHSASSASLIQLSSSWEKWCSSYLVLRMSCTH